MVNTNGSVHTFFFKHIFRHWRGVILFLVPGVLVFLAWSNYVVLFGASWYPFRFGARNPSIIRLQYESDIVQKRLTAGSRLQWFFNAQNVPFTAQLTRLVDLARLSFKLHGTDTVAVSLQADRFSSKHGVDNRLLRHPQLDSLTWNRVEQGNVTLWQSPYQLISPATATHDAVVQPVRQYASVDEFIQSSDPDKRAAYVGLHPLHQQRMVTYAPATTPLLQTLPLVGSYRALLYTGGEDIDITLSVLDTNASDGPDDVTSTLSRIEHVRLDGIAPLTQAVLHDDGIREPKKTISSEKTLRLFVQKPAPGYYALHVFTTTDIRTVRIVSEQHYFFFDAPVRIQTNEASEISLNNTESLQIESVQGGSQFRMGDKKKILAPTQQEVIPKSTAKAISLQGDFIISSKGLFGFGDAEVPNIDLSTTLPLLANIDLKKYNYILAEYQPKIPGTPVEVEEVYSLSQLSRKNQQLHFQLNFSEKQSRASTVQITAGRISYQRIVPVWRKIWNRIKH